MAWRVAQQAEKAYIVDRTGREQPNTQLRHDMRTMIVAQAGVFIAHACMEFIASNNEIMSG